MTLIEMTLVVATIALLVGLALPAVRAMIDSFQSEGGTRSIIHAALNSAQTMALTHQRYIGVRFQKACKSSDPTDPLQGLPDAPQYMIFIVLEDPKNIGDLGDGFRAMKGHEPIKLPETVGVMDLTRVKSNAQIDEPRELSDATTFSIVFSPSGRLVIHDVQVRNRDGYPDTKANTDVSTDDIFNKIAQVVAGAGLFYQDDYDGGASTAYPNLGLAKESSCAGFVLYNCQVFRIAYGNKKGWTQCLGGLTGVYVSPYTGDLISSP